MLKELPIDEALAAQAERIAELKREWESCCERERARWEAEKQQAARITELERALREAMMGHANNALHAHRITAGNVAHTRGVIIGNAHSYVRAAGKALGIEPERIERVLLAPSLHAAARAALGANEEGK